jgi:hypothetical protein
MSEQDRTLEEMAALKLYGPRRVLHQSIVEYLDQAYPYWDRDPNRVPESLRLEMHPMTRLTLLRDPDIEFAHTEPNAFDKLKIPVRVNMDLQPGEWRLVMIAVDYKTGGRLT